MTYEPIDSPVHILLVEDDPDDVVFMQRAFSKVWINYQLHVVRNGEEALAFVRNGAGYEDAEPPDLVLLDLNMPRMNGFEVLRVLKSDDTLKHIPVVVLTTSGDEESMMKSYKLHANSFITKPVTSEGLNRIVGLVVDYWFSAAGRPQNS